MAQEHGRLILVTGPSGAGRTTATNALEDLGCETIDNIPLCMVPKVADGQLQKSPVLVIDTPTLDLIKCSLPAYKDEGISHFAVGLGCTGVGHRSDFVMESLSQVLEQWGGPVSIRHWELDKSAVSLAVPDRKASRASWSG
ncbi:MAG: RNase adapter RapZ [Paracoccaceae bacterium]|nr:RNase adapter RapZ [Paracoccaceae bacterium]